MSYHDLLAASAIRISAITGTLAPALETAYTTRPLTTTQFQSTIFTFSAVKQALLNTEEKLAHAIANTARHPWRAVLADVTATISNSGLIPSVSFSGKQIIGERGSIYDVDRAILSGVFTEKPLAVIRRRVRNANNFYRTPVFYFHIDDQRIYHTRTGVIIDVCVYDRAAQISLINSDGTVLLPGVLEEAYICGTVSMLVRDDEFTDQSKIYRDYFENTLAQIHGGFTTVPAKAAA